MSHEADASEAKVLREGTHRTATLEETWERFGPMAPAAGITRLAEITNLDRSSVPTFVGVRPTSRGLSTSQGKGVTRLAAQVSALMEALEGWHGERARASAYTSFEYAQVETGLKPVDPGTLPRRGARPMGRIPWSIAIDLLSGENMLVPFDSVSTDFTDPWPTSLYRTSNGLASGNTITEATVCALLEVIERSVITDHLTHGLTERILELESIRDSANCELLDKLLRAGLAVRVGVFRRGPVTVMAAYIVPRMQGNGPIDACASGYGAHLDPRIALVRALSEAAQSRVTLISGSRDDFWPSHYERVSRPLTTAAWRAYINSAEPNVMMDELPDASSDSFDLDLKIILSSLKVPAACIVNLSSDDLGVPVVKAVVPGLRGLPFSHSGATRGGKA